MEQKKAKLVLKPNQIHINMLYRLYIALSQVILQTVQDMQDYQQSGEKLQDYERNGERLMETVYYYELGKSYAEKISKPELTCDNCTYDKDKEWCDECDYDAHDRFTSIDVFCRVLNNTNDIVGIGFAYNTMANKLIITEFHEIEDGEFCFKQTVNGDMRDLDVGGVRSELRILERLKYALLGLKVDLSRDYFH